MVNSFALLLVNMHALPALSGHGEGFRLSERPLPDRIKIMYWHRLVQVLSSYRRHHSQNANSLKSTNLARAHSERVAFCTAQYVELPFRWFYSTKLENFTIFTLHLHTPLDPDSETTEGSFACKWHIPLCSLRRKTVFIVLDADANGDEDDGVAQTLELWPNVIK